MSNKKKNRKAKAAEHALYVIVPAQLPPGSTRPAPWGTSRLRELNHGPEATIAVTTAGKAYMVRRQEPPPGLMIFSQTNGVRRLYEDAVGRPPGTPDWWRTAMEASGALDDLCADVEQAFPSYILEVAQLRVRRAEVLAALGREARRDPTTDGARTVLGGPRSPEHLAAHVLVDALCRFDRLGMYDGPERGAAAALFAELSDDVPPDFRAARQFTFKMRRFPGAVHHTDGATVTSLQP